MNFFDQIPNIKICFVFEDSFLNNVNDISMTRLFLVLQGDSMIYSITKINSYCYWRTFRKKSEKFKLKEFVEMAHSDIQ